MAAVGRVVIVIGSSVMGASFLNHWDGIGQAIRTALHVATAPPPTVSSSTTTEISQAIATAIQNLNQHQSPIIIHGTSGGGWTTPALTATAVVGSGGYIYSKIAGWGWKDFCAISKASMERLEQRVQSQMESIRQHFLLNLEETHDALSSEIDRVGIQVASVQDGVDDANARLTKLQSDMDRVCLLVDRVDQTAHPQIRTHGGGKSGEKRLSWWFASSSTTANDHCPESLDY